MRGYAGAIAVGKQSLEDGIGDGVFGKHGINLLYSEVDLVQAFSQGLDFLSEALQLGTVNHVVQPSELVGVEEAPVVAR